MWNGRFFILTVYFIRGAFVYYLVENCGGLVFGNDREVYLWGFDRNWFVGRSVGTTTAIDSKFKVFHLCLLEK
jgi:hypothetical protein